MPIMQSKTVKLMEKLQTRKGALYNKLYLTLIYFQWVVYTSGRWTPSVGSNGLTQSCPKGSSITVSACHRGRGIWRRNWGCTEGGTGDKQWIWERRGALPREQRSERLQHSEGISCSHSKGEWWGRREAWLDHKLLCWVSLREWVRTCGLTLSYNS